MATVSLEILDAAHADGILKLSFTQSQKLYYHPSVVSARLIVDSLEANGCDLTQLVSRTRLNENTLKIYLRWLVKRKYVDIDKVDRQNIYYRRQ